MALKKISRKKTVVGLIILIIILLLVVAGIFLYAKSQNKSIGFINPSKLATNDDNASLVLKVGKLIKLPNENPEIATVSDISKLQDQSIFKNAQNGDKVLIFTKSKRAIVYRPSENIIVEVGNLVAAPQGSSSASVNPSETEAKTVTVTVFNATSTAGYAGRIGNELKSKFPNIEIADTANASNDYKKTIVIDITGKNSDLVNAFAKELGGEVGKLPEGENKPNSDILIILAQ